MIMASYPMDPLKIHLIDIRDKKFVFDVNSEIFFAIDDLVYAILEKMCEVSDERQVVDELSKQHPKEEIIAT
jgi:hypothetical protein